MPQNDFSGFNSILDCLFFGNIFAFFVLNFFYFLPIFNLSKLIAFVKNKNIVDFYYNNQLFLNIRVF